MFLSIGYLLASFLSIKYQSTLISDIGGLLLSCGGGCIGTCCGIGIIIGYLLASFLS